MVQQPNYHNKEGSVLIVNDLDLMKLDIDILDCLNKFNSILTDYIEQYRFISVEPQNAETVQRYYGGIYQLSLAIASVVEAYKEFCYCKGVMVTS